MFALSTYRKPVDSLSGWVDEFLNNEFWGVPVRDVVTAWSPRVDVVEEKDAYRLRADLPGLDKKDVGVSVENGVLTISGERKFERSEKKDGEYEHYERSYGTFTRSFNLPEHVDAEHIEASYRNGVLELTLRKTEQAKPKQIEVKIE